MQKKLIQLVLVSTFIIPQMRAWGGPDDGQAAQIGKISQQIADSGHQYQSNQSFLDFMDDKLLNGAFLADQKRRLKTVGDLMQEAFLYSSPLLINMIPELEKQFNQDLQVRTVDHLVTKFRNTKKSNLRLFHNLMTVMEAQGFSREQMKKAKFFRELGGVNAYAYTAFVQDVGFVLLSGLDEMATPSELRSVMAHELGHVRGGHVFMGVLDSIIQMQVIKQLMGIDPSSIDSSEQSAWATIPDQIIQETQLRLSKSYRFKSEAVNKAISKMMKTADVQISRSFSGAQRTKEFIRYMDSKIETLSGMEVPRKYVQLLLELKQKLQPNQLMRASLPQIIEVMKIVNAADSRNMESSADAYNIAGRPTSGATMDAKFAGTDLPEAMSRQEIEGLVKAVRIEINMARKMSTRAEYYEQIGGPNSGDHPTSNLRVLKQAAFDRHIDRIAMANPFLRHIALRDAVLIEIGQLEEIILEIKEVLNGGQLKAKALKKLRSILNKKSKELSSYQERLPQIELQISNLLADTRFSDGNPRVLNLLDFRLAELQIAQATLTGVEQYLNSEAAAKEVPEAEKPKIIEKFQSIVNAKMQEPLLLKAIAALEAEIAVLRNQTGRKEAKSLAKREFILKQVRAATDSTTSGTVGTLAARTSIGKMTHSKDRISLTEPTRGPKDSNTQWDGSAPQFKDQRILAQLDKKMESTAIEAAKKASGMSCESLFK